MRSRAKTHDSSAIESDRPIRDEVETKRFCSVRASEFAFSETLRQDWECLRSAWGDLEFDRYYGGDNANYRERRYSVFSFAPSTGTLAPGVQTPYLQSSEMNSYVGGIARRFGAVPRKTYENPFFFELVRFSFEQFPIPEEFANQPWDCQVHQIRITVGPGETTAITPEGIHSDGYPFASVHLVDRESVDGAVSSVYTQDERELARLTFEEPLDSLFFEDRALKHYVTPMHGTGRGPCYRSILAISFSLADSPFATTV